MKKSEYRKMRAEHGGEGMNPLTAEEIERARLVLEAADDLLEEAGEVKSSWKKRLYGRRDARVYIVGDRVRVAVG